jgi:tRNA nucleotidyltransferase/poly(A) polymerase
MNNIRNMIQIILEEEFKPTPKSRLISILNSLEFKDEIVSEGGEIYAVGGIVRDAIMGTQSDDLDIVVRGIPYDKLFTILSKYGTPTDTSQNKEDKNFGSTKFVSSNKEFNEFLSLKGIAREIDIMLPRKDAKDHNVKGHKGIKSDVNPMYTIQDDLERRDITINAIAIDINGNLISTGTGLEDIEKGIIKAVNQDAFIEDPLRMLRAVRLAARYNYKWDPVTIKIIKDNAYMLADKQELPKERFLMEFKKMIGKSDLGRAVKALVDFGMYEPIFGITPKIDNYSKFDKAHNVGEFAFMMFENEPLNSIVKLIRDNITNDSYNLSYADALAKYKDISDIGLNKLSKINALASLYKISRDAMMESSYISEDDRRIIRKFDSGELPKGESDIEFRGDEYKGFIIDTIKDSLGEFIPKRDGAKMGRAKQQALQAIYSGDINNDKKSVELFLKNNKDQWID